MGRNEDMLQRIINEALKEDIGLGDITSQLLIPKNKQVEAVILIKENAVIAGLEVVKQIFKKIDKTLRITFGCKDGSYQKKGRIIAFVRGDAQSILRAERTALNLLSHLCGIATATRKFVDRVKPYKVKILDTRKTIPGLRQLQKYAVKIGGGHNHRMGLYDGVLIKDNHIAALCVTCPERSQRVRRASCVKELVETAKAKAPKRLKIEVEVINLEEFKEALTLVPDIIMLDNMKIRDIKKAVEFKRNTRYAQRLTHIEVSGGVTLDNVRAIAKTGVDSISIGSLTHSVKAIDISLEVVT